MSTPAIALQVLQAHDVFACVHYRCTLTARVCVLRQKRALKGLDGRTLTEQTQRASSFCKTGQCEQGRTIREQLGGVDLEAPRPASVFLKPAVVEPIPQEAMKRDEGALRPVEPTQAPTPGSFAGLENREEVIAKPRASLHEAPARANAHTPSAVEAPPPKASTAPSSPASSTSRSNGRSLRRSRSARRAKARPGDRARPRAGARRGPRRDVT